AVEKQTATPASPPASGAATVVKEPTLDEMSEAVQAWFTSRGRAPNSLDELVKARFISKMPAAPAGREYVLDKEHLRVILR
ncbi:MAG: hypothetical protein WCS99_20360, partial [Limisphaerales bacterium]